MLERSWSPAGAFSGQPFPISALPLLIACPGLLLFELGAPSIPAAPVSGSTSDPGTRASVAAELRGVQLPRNTRIG